MGTTASIALSPPASSKLHQPTSNNSISAPTPVRSLFLALPLEIRLQVYGYVMDSNPAKHTHLSPLPTHPPATSSAFFLQAMTVPVAFQYSQVEDNGKTDPESFASTSLSGLPSMLPVALKGQGCGYIPAALLMTCKQVYEEGRLLPWEKNEYAFINWFCSGIYAARSFTRALKPLQRESMRWARIEVLRRDLEDTWVATMIGGRPGTGEWKDLCGLWSGNMETGVGGLWGLRLGIKGPVSASVVAGAVDRRSVLSIAIMEFAFEGGQNEDNGLLDVEAQWVTEGLSQMKALRWLEVEIEDNDVSREAKIDFCVKLGQKMSDISERRVDVRFVEKLAEIKLIKQEEMPWSQPVNDYVWGLDG